MLENVFDKCPLRQKSESQHDRSLLITNPVFRSSSQENRQIRTVFHRCSRAFFVSPLASFVSQVASFANGNSPMSLLLSCRTVCVMQACSQEHDHAISLVDFLAKMYRQSWKTMDVVVLCCLPLL